jgi:molybdate transport system substrate-binding protein
MKRILPVLLALLCLASPVRAGELVVSAAASLTDALADIKPAFEAANPGATVTFNFAASGPLFNQIAQGAPVDVFASADRKWMDKAESAGLVLEGTRVDFAANALVLAVPAGNPAGVKDLSSLTGEKVARIAIGSPETVPAGAYAKAALEKAGLFATLQPKYILGESVRQVIDYISRGEVDAGFVYATDAKKAGDKVKVIAEITLETPVSYPIAVMKGSSRPELARKFIAFLKGPEGTGLLKARGFTIP